MITGTYADLLDGRRHILREALVPILPTPTNFVCEIGSGHGHFLTAYATANPDRVCVGVDLVGERIERALRKRNRAGLTNLHFLRADARLFLECLPADARISTLFILFPDPWPKLRHHKHRILQPDFLDAVATRAAQGCSLHFRTDFIPYYDEARAIVLDHPRWEVGELPWPFEFETVFQQRAGSFASFSAVLCTRPIS